MKAQNYQLISLNPNEMDTYVHVDVTEKKMLPICFFIFIFLQTMCTHKSVVYYPGLLNIFLCEIFHIV